MGIEAKEKNLGSLFEGDFIFEIPRYQRPYSWEEEQAQELMTDLLDAFHNQNPSTTENQYFLGSIVLIEYENDKRYEVIDGQQRLTTLFLLLGCIRHLEQDEERKKEYLGYLQRESSSTKNLARSPRIVLREQEQSFVEDFILNDFQSFLSLNENARNKTSASRNLFQNTNIILENLNNINTRLLDFFQFVWNQVYLIKVTTKESKNVFRIFSVMNNRGLDLTPTDLIKSDILSKISNPIESEKRSNDWESWEESVNRENFSRLFNFICVVQEEDRLRKELVEVFPSVIKAIEQNGKNVLKEIEEYVNAYLTIQNRTYNSSNAKNINQSLAWLNRIPNTDWMPVALLAIKNKIVQPEVLEDLLAKLEVLATFLMIKAANVNKRMQRYKEALKKSKTSTDFLNVVSELSLTKDESAEFLESLNRDIYTLPYSTARYLLLRIDSVISDSQATDYDPKVLTIEHVLPQTVDPNSEWDTIWPNVEIRKEWVHKLGNLVPLNKKRNSSASNFDFQRKITEYFKGSEQVTGYAMTTKLTEYTFWNEDSVKKRQGDLIKAIKKSWIRIDEN